MGSTLQVQINRTELRIQIKIHTAIATWFLTTMSKVCIGDKIVSLANNSGKAGPPPGEEWHKIPISHPGQKSIPVKSENIVKDLKPWNCQRKACGKLPDIGTGKDFPHRTPLTPEIMPAIDKGDPKVLNCRGDGTEHSAWGRNLI